MSAEVLDRLRERFPGDVVSTHADHGDETAVIRRERLFDVCAFLRSDPNCSFEMLTDLTGVDYLGVKEPRFEVVYHLYSLSKNHRLRLKVELGESDPSVDSVLPIWKAANWMERETWDLYGIRFQGHPDLRRILLYDEFQGHPLRKDYDIEHRQPRIPPRPGHRHL